MTHRRVAAAAEDDRAGVRPGAGAGGLWAVRGQRRANGQGGQGEDAQGVEGGGGSGDVIYDGSCNIYSEVTCI